MSEAPGRRPGDPAEKSPPAREQPRSQAHAAAPGDQPGDAPKPPDLVTLTIDGRPVSVPKGTLVVEAAKRLGIEIPVFCYHHKMSPVGACRLCLVEISPGPPKPQTACTTPAAEGMVVQTASTSAVAARADILEFELVNHPLDCPVCDKGGECPLQDFTFRHGYPTSRLDDPKLHFRKPIPLSANIALDRERCVLCYRCTRYYDEIAWEQELTVDQRGAKSYITSQFDQPLQSVFSGNIVDLCPVGALTSRVWRFESRPWDMGRTASVCSRCSVGCNVTLWSRRGQLVRVTSRENDEIDDGWLCDRGRFEYTEVNDAERLRRPRIGGRDATWDEALAAVAAATRGKGNRLGVSIPQDITNEELFLLGGLLAGPWKGARVAMQNRTLLPKPAGATARISDLDAARTVVVVASDTRVDVPVINLRIKKAATRGAHLVVIHAGDLDLDRAASIDHLRPAPGGAAAAVRELARHRLAGPVVVLYGDGRGTEDPVDLTAAVGELAAAADARVLPLYRGTNERGALAWGVVPETPVSLDGVEALFCWGPGPEGGVPASARFVAVFDSHLREGHDRGGREADVVMPSTTFAERQGSYTSVEGRVQAIRPVLEVRTPLRETWEVLGDLGLSLGLSSAPTGILQIQRDAAAALPEAWSELAGMAERVQEPAAGPVMLGPARP